MKESKRKNKMIVEGNKKELKKQRSKKRNKKEKFESSIKIKSNEIPTKYKNNFEEAGLRIEEFYTSLLKGDGACGADSTAMHCHRS